MTATGEIILRSQISGAFYGFKSDALFKLTNGTYWLQTKYKYWYHYAYMPQVEIIRDGGSYFLRLVGYDQMIHVKQLSGVIESQLSDVFNGWQGDSEYELTNGQVWKQDRYKYEYKYLYRPRVLIYDTPSGKIMDVEGSRAIVARIR